MKKIVVVGSLNMDTVIETPRRPRGGETITGRRVSLAPGGKGANQAFAVGKLGGHAALVGAVGDDAPGQALRQSLESVGVDTGAVETIGGGTTGQAFITVDDAGENAIIIIAGTNAAVTEELAGRHRALLEAADIIITQLEIPLATVLFVKDLALRAGKTLIIDPAPAVKGLPDSLWQGVDYIKPNETELGILTGRTLTSAEDLKSGAEEMLKKGVKQVIVSMGAAGCMLVRPGGAEFFPALPVRAVDTTAAGDCFTAAFALALSEGRAAEDAIAFAQEASAIAVTRVGAQTSIPSRAELERYWRGGRAE